MKSLHGVETDVCLTLRQAVSEDGITLGLLPSEAQCRFKHFKVWKQPDAQRQIRANKSVALRAIESNVKACHWQQSCTILKLQFTLMKLAGLSKRVRGHCITAFWLAVKLQSMAFEDFGIRKSKPLILWSWTPLAKELKHDEDVHEAMLSSERYALLHSVKASCTRYHVCPGLLPTSLKLCFALCSSRWQFIHHKTVAGTAKQVDGYALRTASKRMQADRVWCKEFTICMFHLTLDHICSLVPTILQTRFEKHEDKFMLYPWIEAEEIVLAAVKQNGKASHFTHESEMGRMGEGGVLRPWALFPFTGAGFCPGGVAEGPGGASGGSSWSTLGFSKSWQFKCRSSSLQFDRTARRESLHVILWTYYEILGFRTSRFEFD